MLGSAASDPAILASLRSDLATFPTAVGRILGNLGIGGGGITLSLQTNVASTTNPRAAALLQSLLTNVATDLQEINTTVASLGTSLSTALSSELSSSLTQLGNLISDASIAVNNGIGLQMPSSVTATGTQSTVGASANLATIGGFTNQLNVYATGIPNAFNPLTVTINDLDDGILALENEASVPDDVSLAASVSANLPDSTAATDLLLAAMVQ